MNKLSLHTRGEGGRKERNRAIGDPRRGRVLERCRGALKRREMQLSRKNYYPDPEKLRGGEILTRKNYEYQLKPPRSASKALARPCCRSPLGWR